MGIFKVFKSAVSHVGTFVSNKVHELQTDHRSPPVLNSQLRQSKENVKEIKTKLLESDEFVRNKNNLCGSSELLRKFIAKSTDPTLSSNITALSVIPPVGERSVFGENEQQLIEKQGAIPKRWKSRARRSDDVGYQSLLDIAEIGDGNTSTMSPIQSEVSRPDERKTSSADIENCVDQKSKNKGMQISCINDEDLLLSQDIDVDAEAFTDTSTTISLESESVETEMNTCTANQILGHEIPAQGSDKNRGSEGVTSDYCSLDSVDSGTDRWSLIEESSFSFTRNCQERISTRTNSEPRLFSKSKLETMTEAPPPEPPRSNINIVFNDKVQNAQISNEGTSVMTRSFGTTESSVLNQRVQKQTVCAIKEIEQDVGGIKTKALEWSLQVLDKHNFLVLSGDGRTYLAKQLTYFLTQDNDIEPYVLMETKEYSIVDCKHGAVVLIYDITGTTDFDRSRFDKMVLHIKRVLQTTIKNGGNQRVIVTLRHTDQPAVQSFIDDNKQCFVDLSAPEMRSSFNDLSQIFDAIMTKHGIDLNFSKQEETYTSLESGTKTRKKMAQETTEEILANVDKQNFIEQLTQFFANHTHEGVGFFLKPTRDNVEKIDRYREQDAYTFFIFLAALENNGELTIQQIDSLQGLTIKTDHELKTVLQRGYTKHTSPNNPSMMFMFAKKSKLFKDKDMHVRLMNALIDVDRSLIEKEGDTYRFASKAVENSLRVVCYKEFPVHVLQSCPWEFLASFVGSSRHIQKPHHDVRITVSDGNTQSLKAIYRRFIDDIKDWQVLRTWGHQLFRERWFLENFIAELETTKHMTKDILLKQDKDESYYCLYFVLETKFSVQYGNQKANTVADYLLDLPIWKEKIKKSTYEENIKLQFREILDCAVELGLEPTVKRLIQYGIHASKETFDIALRSGKQSMIDLLIEKEPSKGDSQWLQLAFEADNRAGAYSHIGKSLFMYVAERFEYHFGVNAVQKLFFKFVKDNREDMLARLFTVITEFRLQESFNVDGYMNCDTALLIATKANAVPVIQILLKRGANQRLRDDHDDMPVHIAAGNGNCEILDMLYETDLTVAKDLDARGDTPLHISVICGNTAVVRYHMNKYGLSQNDILNVNGETAIHTAVKNKCHDILELVAITADGTIEDNAGFTALDLACRNKDYRCVEILLNGNAVKKDQRLLDEAIDSNDEILTKLLINGGYSVTQDNSLLFKAVNNQYHGLTAILLAHGWDVNSVSNGMYPIHIACLNNDLRMIQMLAEHGAHLTAKTHDRGQTIAHIAAEQENPHTLRGIFAMSGSSSLVPVVDNEYQSALHVACKLGQVEHVRVLLDAGFSGRSNSCGKTPHELVEEELRKKKKGKKKKYAEIMKIFPEL